MRPGQDCRTACLGLRFFRSTLASRTKPSSWEDPALVQLWGPRHNVFTVATRDLAVFSLGVFPDAAKGRRRAEDLAGRLHACSPARE